MNKTDIIYDYLVTCIDDKEIKTLIEKLQDYLYNGSFMADTIQEEQVIELIEDIKKNYSVINNKSERKRQLEFINLWYERTVKDGLEHGEDSFSLSSNMLNSLTIEDLTEFSKRTRLTFRYEPVLDRISFDI